MLKGTSSSATSDRSSTPSWSISTVSFLSAAVAGARSCFADGLLLIWAVWMVSVALNKSACVLACVHTNVFVSQHRLCSRLLTRKLYSHILSVSHLVAVELRCYYNPFRYGRRGVVDVFSRFERERCMRRTGLELIVSARSSNFPVHQPEVSNFCCNHTSEQTSRWVTVRLSWVQDKVTRLLIIYPSKLTNAGEYSSRK